MPVRDKNPTLSRSVVTTRAPAEPKSSVTQCESPAPSQPGSTHGRLSGATLKSSGGNTATAGINTAAPIQKRANSPGSPRLITSRPPRKAAAATRTMEPAPKVRSIDPASVAPTGPGTDRYGKRRFFVSEASVCDMVDTGAAPLVLSVW